MQGNQAGNILAFQINRNFKLLLKNFLELFEDNYNQHDIMIAKMKEVIPAEYHVAIDNCNYLTANRRSYLRKRTLDAGNDRLREVEDFSDKFEVDFVYNR